MDNSEIFWTGIPSWLGAVSLILAFTIFRRDRDRDERAQVDLVGSWVECVYDPRLPDADDPLAPIFARAHLRNASELPVSVAQLAYTIETTWFVPDATQGLAWSQAPGVGTSRHFVDDVHLPPKATHELAPVEIDISHLAPDGAQQLSPFNGARATVDWMLVTDNAGRRWCVGAVSGGPAQRVNRRWRRREYMPRGWP